MKCLSSILLAVFIFSAGAVNAQSIDEILESKNRISELMNLDLSLNSGVESLDNFTNAVKEAADETVEVSSALNEINQKVVDKSGNPSLSELTVLGTRVNKLSSSVTEASKLSIDAVKDLKELKSTTKILSATHTLNEAKGALETISKETVYQTKTIASLIKAISK